MHSDAALMSKPSIWHEALRIVNEEGFRAFWKGNMVTIAHRLPYTSVNFYSYEQYKSVSIYKKCITHSLLHFTCLMKLYFMPIFLFQILRLIPGLDGRRGNSSSDFFVHFVGGGLAGITAASATYPLDLIRTRLAAQVQ